MPNRNMATALVHGEMVAPERTGQRATCPRCGEEVRSHCGKRPWYWQHVELSPVCHAEDLRKAGLTYEQWRAGERPRWRR